MMKPLNVLVLMSDEHCPKMMGCAGHPLAYTPNIDALAQRGTRFASAYSNSPICVPARASFATGRYVHEMGYWDNSIAYDGRVPGWGHYLQHAGIPVASVGKLHYRQKADPLGLDQQWLPMHVKDGVGMVHLSIRRQYPDFVARRRQIASIPMSADRGESEYTKYDRRVADKACELLRERRPSDPPWVLFVSLVTPHYPLVVPDEFLDRFPPDQMPPAKFAPDTGYVPHPWFEKLNPVRKPGSYDAAQQRKAFAAYLGLTHFMDAQIGRVLQALDEAGLRDSTRILYTADHGENAGARGMWGKSNHYEEACGVPFIIAGPDVPEGKVCHTPVTLVDAHPTILHGAGLPHEDASRPGRSLFELATQAQDRERVVFSEYHAAGSPSAAYMLRQGRFKLIEYVGYEPELFDLQADPEEGYNLAADAAHAATLARLRSLLRGIVDPVDADRRANQAQKDLIDSRGGPDAVMDHLVTEKNYTPVPDEIAAGQG